MADKSFITIPQSECITAYKDILNNSDKLWDSAKALSGDQHYGYAISMHIISIEELVKALLVFFDGNGFEFRKIKGINIFFKNHQIRYVISYLMFIMSIFGEEIKKFILKIKEEPGMMMSIHQEMKADENYFEKKLKYYFFRKLVLLKKEFHWFSTIDKLRQNGLYFDFDKENNNPLNISAEEYDQILSRLNKVRVLGKEFITSFDSRDPEIQKALSKMKEDFINDGYYIKIENSLTKLKQNKGGPFKQIALFFQEMF